MIAMRSPYELSTYIDMHLVACSEPGLQPDTISDTTQAALCHDGNAVSENVSLFHAMRGEHDASVLLGCLDNIPNMPVYTYVFICVFVYDACM
jgi:hypothetical protein